MKFVCSYRISEYDMYVKRMTARERYIMKLITRYRTWERRIYRQFRVVEISSCYPHGIPVSRGVKGTEKIKRRRDAITTRI